MNPLECFGAFNASCKVKLVLNIFSHDIIEWLVAYTDFHLPIDGTGLPKHHEALSELRL